MDNRLLTKLALLDALAEENGQDPGADTFRALLEELTPQQQATVAGYCRYQRRKQLCRILAACRHMEFRDPLLRNILFSGDPAVRKREAQALIRVKKHRKIT